MKTIIRQSIGAFTLIELLIGMVVAMVLGLAAYSILINATELMAKNVSLNASNTTLRSALDRVYAESNLATALPTLLNVDGSTAGGTGPAAGVAFDRYLGGPFIVQNPSGNGLKASDTTFQIKVSTDGVAYSAAPKQDDVLLMDDGTTRPLVQNCTPATLAKNTGLQTLTVTLQAPLGKTVSWTSAVQKIANTVHREAFIVATVGTRAELRFYRNAEALAPGNYNDSSTYSVLTREIGTATGDTIPFSVVTQSGTSFLNIAMRVEDHQYNNYLASHQAKEFNTFLRVDTMLRPRNIP
jgi:type II secretory pathway pseudopilin PulG